MNKQLLTLLWSLLLKIGFTVVYCFVAYNYIVHDIEPSNMIVLALLTILIITSRQQDKTGTDE
jgi:hypothetical protein